MLVNKTLAQFSDWSYFTAFAFYLVAFVVSIAYYSRRIAAAEAKSQVAERELVAAGAGGGSATAMADSGELATKSSASEPKNQALTNKLGVVAEMLIYVGVAVHFASVLLRGLAVQRFPWGNLYEYVSVSILIAMVVGAGVLHRETMRVFWPWMLAPILALMFYGGRKLYAEAAPVVPALQSIWLPIHVSIIAIGCKLDAIPYRTAIWSFPLFGLGIVLGAIWAESAWGRYWGWDPKETTALISWIIYALYLHARATSGWRNTKAAWINIFGFATMVFNLFFINMVVAGLHSYAGLN